MNEHNLFDAVGDIDDDMINDVSKLRDKKQNKSNFFVTFASIAASTVLLTGISVTAFHILSAHNGLSKDYDILTEDPDGNAPDGYVNNGMMGNIVTKDTPESYIRIDDRIYYKTGKTISSWGKTGISAIDEKYSVTTDEDTIGIIPNPDGCLSYADGTTNIMDFDGMPYVKGDGEIYVDSSNQNKWYIFSEMPEGNVVRWFDFENTDTRVPKFMSEYIFDSLPDVKFRYSTNIPNADITVIKGDESRCIAEKAVFRNIYFTDLNGDKTPEICITIDDSALNEGYDDKCSHIEVYDIANDKSYSLTQNGPFNYNLIVKNDTLIVQKSKASDNSQVMSGKLSIADNTLTIISI